MNPKSIERALDRYRAFKDEDVRRRLAIFGPLILEAAAISNELDDEDVVVEREPTADETIAASSPTARRFCVQVLCASMQILSAAAPSISGRYCSRASN